ncbi:hypothetical protein LINGRAHAP2_LOCUS24373 [Linum grandiflorum]
MIVLLASISRLEFFSKPILIGAAQILFTVMIHCSPSGFTVHDRLLLHNMEIQGVNEYLLLCEDEHVNMDGFDLQSDSTVRLGPYFKNSGPSPHLSHLDRYPFGGGTLLFVDLLCESQGVAFFQQPKSKHQKPIGVWPLKDPAFNQWYARLCSNCFVFREPIGAMKFTLMDLVTITRLSLPTINRRSTTSSDNQFIIEPKTYLNLRRKYQPSNPTVPVTQQERVGFIHYWLYKFIHCPTTLGPRLGLSQLSHQITNGETPSDFAENSPASLYHGMHTLSRQLLTKSTAAPTGSGPLWLVSFWLYAYFPKLQGPTSQLSNGKAHPSYGHELLTASSLKKYFAYYFKYFYTVSKIANFAPFIERNLGHPSFAEIHTAKPTDRNDPKAVSYQRYVFKWKSWLSSRDIFVNVLGKDNSTFAEAYNPHYVAHQFGLIQMWHVSIAYLSQFKDPI